MAGGLKRIKRTFKHNMVGVETNRLLCKIPSKRNANRMMFFVDRVLNYFT